jgi:hypothetical protein
VQFVGVCANDSAGYPDDAPARLLARWREKRYGFPYCIDATQAVARAFDAVCTPDIFVYDADLRLAYHGRIDDNWKEPEKVSRRELAAALDALVAGQRPSDRQHHSIGCSIKGKDASERASDAAASLGGFQLGLADDTERRDRAGLQTLDADLLAALFADAVGVVVDALERFVDLGDQLALAIADPQGEVAVALERGSIARVGKLLRAFPHAVRRAGCLAHELFSPLVEEIPEHAKVALPHDYLSRTAVPSDPASRNAQLTSRSRAHRVLRYVLRHQR